MPNIKGFARVYELTPKNTLYAFHKQMQSDMSFPPDQMVLFKGFDDKGALIARYATFDLGQGSIEHISVAQFIEVGITNFVYFYDTTNKLSVLITLEGEGAGKELKPTLVESKGPNPEEFLNGYVAFEDLPPEKQKHPDDDGFVDDDDDEDADGSSDEDDDDGYAEETEGEYDEDEAGN